MWKLNSTFYKRSYIPPPPIPHRPATGTPCCTESLSESLSSEIIFYPRIVAIQLQDSIFPPLTTFLPVVEMQFFRSFPLLKKIGGAWLTERDTRMGHASCVLDTSPPLF